MIVFSGWRKPVLEGFAALMESARKGKVEAGKINKAFEKILELKSKLRDEQN